MNEEQVKGLIRQVLPGIGWVLSYMGYGSPEDQGHLADLVLQAVGPLMVLGSFVWSMFSKTNAAMVANAIAIPEVKSITTEANKKGVELANSVPDPNVVVSTAGRPYVETMS